MRFEVRTALLAVGLVAALTTVRGTGYCPDPRVMRIACDGSRVVERCSVDSECSAGRRCCPSPCGWTECFDTRETAPSSPKNGECAPSRREVTLCMAGSMENSTAECSSDWDCAGNLKCCEQACVKDLCRPPVVVKEGQCMMHAMGCGDDEPHDRVECESDSDCIGSLKCCSTRCFGATCQRPDPSTVPTKPGECVRVPWEVIDCAIMPPDALPNCTSDYECPGDQKCCDYPCAPQRCRDPVKEGTCPDFTGVKIKCPATPAPDTCVEDSDCDGELKCCEGPCHNMGCWEPEPEKTPPPPEKEGVCIRIMIACLNQTGRPNDTCKNDFDCPDSQKCCSQPCGNLLCVPTAIVDPPPPVEHPGECPASPIPSGNGDGAEVGQCGILCDDDSGCSPTSKCCKNDCGGTQCYDLTGGPDPPMEQFECPYYNKDLQCFVRGTVECNSTTCDDGSPCCDIECQGTKCGRDLCPVPDPNVYCVRKGDYLCNSTQDCANDEICCRDSCGGRRCIKKSAPPSLIKQADDKEGQCMMHAMGCGPDEPQGSVDCKSDSDCIGSLKCCSTRCFGATCQRPDPSTVPTKPGECVRVPWEKISCPVMPAGALPNCTSDYECPGDQKCCDYPCAPQRCRDPASDSEETNPPPEKEGECEDFSNIRALCIEGAYENSTAECDNDIDCEGSYKCCPQLCVKPLCKPPLKEGRCPMTIQGCPSDQPMPGPRQCSDDFNCTGDLKCCGNGCGGTNCVKPDIEVHPGQCPMFKCREGMNKTDTCSNDGQCSYGQKCCAACEGKRCLDAYVPPPPEKEKTKEGVCMSIMIACLNQTGRPNDTCKNDFDCPDSQKCCAQPCGNLLCVPAAIVDPPPPVETDPPEQKYECPYYAKNRQCLVRGPVECNSTTCDDGSPCCDTECQGTKCGRDLCPVPDPNIRCIRKGDYLCNSTDDCGKDAICCNDGCGGRRCINKHHPGTCPDTTGTIGLCAILCHGDYACQYNEKCCSNGCGGKQCLAAVGNDTVTPVDQTKRVSGVCPVFNANKYCDDKRYAYQCTLGESCSTGGQCCEIECKGTRCEPDLCPAPLDIVCAKAETRECESTADCGDKSQICCNIHCGGTRCKSRGSSDDSSSEESEESQQGIKQADNGLVCPAIDTNVTCSASLSRRACASDAECGSKKCCPSGCKGVNICKTPDKPGTCRHIDSSTIRCMAPSEQQKCDACGTDMGCQGNKKCCDNPCPGWGKTCEDPEY